MTQDSISSKNALYDHFIAEHGVESEWKRCSSPLSIEEMLSIWVWIQLNRQMLYHIRPQVLHWNKIQLRFRICQRLTIMTGQTIITGLEVLDHSGISVSDYSCSPFSILIHILYWIRLTVERNIEIGWEKGILFWYKGLEYDSISQSKKKNQFHCSKWLTETKNREVVQQLVALIVGTRG